MTTAVRHPIFARLFDYGSRRIDEGEQRAHRARLVRGLAGRVIEVGAGNGLNFLHYPAQVTEVVAVEPEPFLRARASEAAATAPVPVVVVDGTAEALPLEDESCDAAVASLVLCSVRDQRAALAEIHRVLRAGGELRFYEHVRSEAPHLARWQRRVDHLWPHLGGGCHASRDTLAAIRSAGFRVEELEQFTFKPTWCATLTSPHILGRAYKQN
jgi:ubiquinone/menaquinone biosynthesis C-methylase UbiE